MKHSLTLFWMLLCTCAVAQVPFSPDVAPPAADDDSYRLSPRDLIEVAVYRQEDLSAEQRIDSVGKIQVPLIGSMDVGGLTIREAENKVEEAYREQQMLANPQVSIRISEYAPKQVSVLGEVKNPGMVDFAIETYRMDLREVIARAGGFTPVARRGSIQVFRKRTDGSEETLEVDFGRLLNRGPDERPFYVYDKDVVFIPDRIF